MPLKPKNGLFVILLLAVIFIFLMFIILNMEKAKLKVTSVFEQGKPIPKKYTCEGENINPPLFIENIPKEAKTLAIIMDDPDAPSGVFVHWVLWNHPLENVEEGTKKGENGITSFGKNGYGGPCPPRGHGTHRYYFKVYAINKTLNLSKNTNKEQLLKAIEDSIVAYGELMGTYRRD